MLQNKHSNTSYGFAHATNLETVINAISYSYNRQKNELRHIALKGLFNVFLTSKREKIALSPPPSPPYNVVPLFELPLENNKHPNFEWRAGVWILLFSEVTLFEYNVSTILSVIVDACCMINFDFFPLFAFLFSRARKITHNNFEVNKGTLEKKVKCNNAKMTIDCFLPGVGHGVE